MSSSLPIDALKRFTDSHSALMSAVDADRTGAEQSRLLELNHVRAAADMSASAAEAREAQLRVRVEELSEQVRCGFNVRLIDQGKFAEFIKNRRLLI